MPPSQTKPLSSDGAEHLLPAADGPATPVSTTTPGAAEEEIWQKRNRRRLQLIDKECSETLGPEEEKELADLQAEFAQRLAKALPLPFGILGELKTCARSEGLLPAPSEPTEMVE